MRFTSADLAKPLKFINLSIAVLLLLVLIAVYWVALRPLADTSGEVPAPVGTRATVVRDAIGVPPSFCKDT